MLCPFAKELISLLIHFKRCENWMSCRAGCCGSGNWCKIWSGWEPRHVAQMVRHCGGALHLHIRGRLRVVVGASRLACAEWNLSIRDSFSCSKYKRFSQYVLHIRHCSSLLDHALSYEVRTIHFLCLLCSDHVHLHCVLLARDQGHSNWRDE